MKATEATAAKKTFIPILEGKSAVMTTKTTRTTMKGMTSAGDHHPVDIILACNMKNYLKPGVLRHLSKLNNQMARK